MNKHAIKSGVMVGVISIVITLLIYLVDPTFFASFWMLLIFFVLFVILISYFGIQHRKEGEGYMGFGPAWVYSFQAMVVAGLLGVIFRILLFTVIDPDLTEIVVDASIQQQEAMLNNFGVPADQMDEQLERAREATEDGLSAKGSLIGFLWGLIIYAILSLITGAIIKKKEPELEG